MNDYTENKTSRKEVDMTQNQIQFANYVESNRHNLATENETHRSNVANLGEVKRNNKAVLKETHQHNSRTRKEIKRHNKATERLTGKDISEKKRHNKATESLTSQQNVEQGRHNLATESLTNKQIDTNYQQTIEAAQIGANAHVQSARIAGAATTTAAGINAAASKYATDSQYNLGVFKEQMSNLRNSKSIQSNEDINEANNLVKSAISTAELMQKYAAQNDTVKLREAELELQKLRDQAQRAYNQGKLRQEWFRDFQNALSNWMGGGKSLIKYLK